MEKFMTVFASLFLILMVGLPVAFVVIFFIAVLFLSAFDVFNHLKKHIKFRKILK